MDFDELDLFFNDFGIEITLPLVGGERVINALFFEFVTEIFQLAQLNSDQLPILLVKTEDTTDIDRDEVVVINDIDYSITGVEPDGTGWTVITLEKDSDAD